MRRFLAILLTAINLCLVAPGLVASASFGASSPQLPPCCRATGAHRCARHMLLPASAPSSVPSIGPQAKCPYFPSPNGFTALTRPGIPASRQTLFRAATNPAVLQPPSESWLRLSLPRAVSERGPPFSL